MILPLTRKSTDHSGREKFSFSFFCDRCGKEWKSRSMSFMAGGFSKIDHEEARQLLWAHERRVAFEQANTEAHLKFDRCSLCGVFVCDECFNQDADVCKNCKTV